MACERTPSWCPPPIAKPLVLFMRRVLTTLAIIPSCGVWYRRILARVRIILCLLTCQGEIYGDEITVTDEMTVLRSMEPLAKKTYINNIGLNKARIFENGALIRILYAGESMESPTQGRLEMSAICDATKVTAISITTSKRCDCGVVLPYYYSSLEPIGGPLI